MHSSTTPSLDAWQDLHAKASKLEHDLLMAALSYMSVGGQPPTRKQADEAKAIRAHACAKFDEAIDELMSLIERTTLASRLYTRPPGG